MMRLNLGTSAVFTGSEPFFGSRISIKEFIISALLKKERFYPLIT